MFFLRLPCKTKSTSKHEMLLRNSLADIFMQRLCTLFHHRHHHRNVELCNGKCIINIISDFSFSVFMHVCLWLLYLGCCCCCYDFNSPPHASCAWLTIGRIGFFWVCTVSGALALHCFLALSLSLSLISTHCSMQSCKKLCACVICVCVI